MMTMVTRILRTLSLEDDNGYKDIEDTKLRG